MTQELVSELSVVLPSVLLTVMLAFFVMTDTYIGRDHRSVLLVVCALIFSLIAQNYADMLLQGRYVNIPLRMAVSIIGYILRPTILVLFCHVVDPRGRFRAAWALSDSYIMMHQKDGWDVWIEDFDDMGYYDGRKEIPQ